MRKKTGRTEDQETTEKEEEGRINQAKLNSSTMVRELTPGKRASTVGGRWGERNPGE